jgi:serpin B
MLILLPKETFGLKKVMEKFTGETLQTMWNLMTPKRVILSLPKFALNETYSLNGVLSGIGMGSLFAPGANLSLMTDDVSLFLDTLYHRAMVSNDEAGSDAGTPYEVALPPLSSTALANPALFTADHPFLMMIVDTDARAVLFMGKVGLPATDSP